MKRTVVWICVCLLLLSGCGLSLNTNVTEYTGTLLYFPASNVSVGSEGLYGEAREEETDGIEPAALLALLFQGPQSEKLKSPFPIGLHVLSWTIGEGTMEVDLSEEYAALSDMDLVLADYCITLTLMHAYEVDRVKITVEGSPLVQRHNQTLARSDLLEGSVSDMVIPADARSSPG